MFSLHSSRKAAAAAFVSLLLVAASVLSTVSCKQSAEDETTSSTITTTALSSSDTLAGTWLSTYSEYYVLDASGATLTNYYGSLNSSSKCYAGSNLCLYKQSDTSGYIYIKYTGTYDSSTSAYSESTSDVGKWYALYYKGLTSSSIQISGAYKSTGVTSESTLEEAIAEFTVDNGYFSAFSTCTKQ